ncbi:MAG: molecular chaperone HtpG [Christensenellales bacterium]|jgi:molecular chaperone HtpG
MTAVDSKTREISINAQNMMPIIKKWLYSDKDIFVRELIANGVDAITKHKRLTATGEAEYDPAPYFVQVAIDFETKTLRFSDNGLGMTADEAERFLGEVAFSGAAEFAKKYEQKGDDAIIGHFGLGFYSAFMVANRVVVESKSYLPDTAPARWESDGVSEFTLSAGSRSTRGTDVILYLNEDDEEFLSGDKLTEIIKKYCSFLPVPIFLLDPVAEKEREEAGKEAEKEEHDHECACGHDHEDHECACGHDHKEDSEEKEDKPCFGRQLNNTSPLWLKNPKDCTEEEYKSFYRSVFQTFDEPLFWLHLNVDYPFNLKGILYFPKLRADLGIEGQIKLYNNQVFVADNIKEVIPEFLMLLRGVIDCPDLPLNVSRSMLQNDGTVKKVQTHITKKTAERLNQLFEENRETYEKDWNDIAPFVRYGAVRDEKFFEQVQSALLFEKLDGTFCTLEQLKEQAKNEGGRIFYVTDKRSQSFYIDLFKEQGQSAILMGGPVDEVFINFLEYTQTGLSFARIDADVAPSVKGQYEDMPELAPLETLMRKAAGDDRLTVMVEPLKSEELLSMLVMDEQSRRFYDMAMQYGSGMPAIPPSAKLILNGASPVIKSLAKETDEEKANLIAAYVYDLALIGSGRMNEEQSKGFFKRASKVLSLLAKTE